MFRIGVGLVGLVLSWRFFANGWVDSLFVDPAFHFTYPGFEWVRVWPGWGMHAHFGLIALRVVGRPSRVGHEALRRVARSVWSRMWS